MIHIPKKSLIILGTFLLIILSIVWFISKLGSTKVSFTEERDTRLPEIKTTSLFFGGDIMLSRQVAAKMYAANDFTLPFIQVMDRIRDADIAFANLESPFNDMGDHSISGSLVFNADPESIAGLKSAGWDILSTANNHSFDQGEKGINFTLDHLAANGIIPVGTGLDCHAGKILIKNNLRFGFLAYSYTALNDGGRTSDPLVCDANDLPQIKSDIQTLRSQVDYLIVSTHMGIEYQRLPSTSQTAFAHQAVDAGADLIIGNHPHWVQSIEQYQGKWIFYALGNFVFDQMWSIDTRQGLTVDLRFKNQTLDYLAINPIIIENFCCPRWADQTETLEILNKIHPQTTTKTIIENGAVTNNWQNLITINSE